MGKALAFIYGLGSHTFQLEKVGWQECAAKEHAGTRQLWVQAPHKPPLTSLLWGRTPVRGTWSPFPEGPKTCLRSSYMKSQKSVTLRFIGLGGHCEPSQICNCMVGGSIICALCF